MVTAVVVMGVSGSGKSTVGAALADHLGGELVDGDDLHPPANVDKMRRGIPLDDADRAPWLDRINQLLRSRLAARDPVVVACSALKRAYRERLAQGLNRDEVAVVFLRVDRAALEERIKARRGHHIPASLLDSQLATLEPPGPDEAVTVDANRPVTAVVADIAAAVRPGAEPAERS